MGPDDLIALIEALRQRAQTYDAALHQSESLTRYALIDPLLRALGWDTGDPGLVRPEYAAGSGSADYALFDTDSSPLVLLEAKKLGEKLPPIAMTAVVGYAGALAKQGAWVKLLGSTSGILWELYEYPTLTPKFALDLAKGTPAEAAHRALGALWRPLLRPPPVSHEPDKTSPPDLVPLDKLTVRAGDHAPKLLRLPDSQERTVGTWRSLLVEVARHLVETGKLGPEHCPILAPGSHKYYLVHTESRHPSGRNFDVPKAIGQIQVETWVGATDSHRKALFLLRRFGEDPSQYLVELP